MDKEVLEDFVNGEETALQIVIDKYSHRLLKYCYTILLDYHNAQDVVQETFIKAYIKRGQFDIDTSLSAWLHCIAYRTSLNVLKKSKKRGYFSFQISSNECNYISEPLKSSLLKLKECDRALLYGRAVEEQSYQELQSILNVSATTLRKRFERIRKKMMKELSSSYSQYR